VGGGLVALGLLLSEPVAHNLFVGQLSIFIVFLAVVDAGGFVPARWRGIGVGLAAAIKLIPLVFIGYYLVTRQWRAALQSFAGFVVATALGFFVMPAESVRYWTVLVFDTSRVGDVWLSRNKSLLGLLTRWGLGDARWLWLVLAAAIAALALWRARQHHARGEEFAATLVVGCLSIVLTPISWPHHQIWVPLVALYLLLLGRRWPVIAGSLLLACYSIATPLITWEESGPLWQRLLWEVPVLLPIVIAILGLPRKVVATPGVRTPQPTGHLHGSR
jgi:alpha-1,2-mannosyltransferase